MAIKLTIIGGTFRSSPRGDPRNTTRRKRRQTGHNAISIPRLSCKTNPQSKFGTSQHLPKQIDLPVHGNHPSRGSTSETPRKQNKCTGHATTKGTIATRRASFQTASGLPDNLQGSSMSCGKVQGNMRGPSQTMQQQPQTDLSKMNSQSIHGWQTGGRGHSTSEDNPIGHQTKKRKMPSTLHEGNGSDEARKPKRTNERKGKETTQN